MDRAEFVRKCGELLAIAKPNLVKCELVLGRDIEVAPVMRQHEHYAPDDEYVLVTCENGYTYKLPVECNSLAAIAAEIFGKMMYK